MRAGIAAFAIGLVAALSACAPSPERAVDIVDHHVHLMSPRLIKLFTDVGIPFSRPFHDYSVLDSLLRRVGTERVQLASMAYLYGHPEFGPVDDEYRLAREENDYVMSARDSSRGRATAYCGINPLREYAVSEIDRCAGDLRTDGIKLHFNASQVYLTEPEHLQKVQTVFAAIARHRLPVMLHFDNSHPKFGADDVDLLLNEVLAGNDSLRIQIAHLGTSGGFSDKTERVINRFIEHFDTSTVLRRHTLLFDPSAAALDKDSEGVPKLSDAQFVQLADLLRRLGMQRLVFGTDYPLYSVAEYQNILRTRVGLTEAEMEQIMSVK